MFCDRCGESNRPTATFCRGCGSPLSKADEPTDETVGLPGDRTPDVPESLRRALSGKIDLQRLLGKGGMGEVYLGRELSLDRLVAVKILPPSAAGDPDLVKRFLREARLAARLRHPNIVAIHSVDEVKGINSFTMDFIDGVTLGEYIRVSCEAGLTSPEAEALILQVAKALAHAHASGIVHRDLKPANVMVEPSGHVVVMDFGLARSLGDVGLTSSNVVVGTPRYMSPEQLAGGPVDAASDVFALGLLAFYVYTGRELIRGKTVPAIVAEHANGGPSKAARRAEELTESRRVLLSRVLDPDFRKRPTAADFIEVLSGPEKAAVADPSSVMLAGRLPGTPGKEVPAPKTPTPSPAASPYRKLARERIRRLLEDDEE